MYLAPLNCELKKEKENVRNGMETLLYSISPYFTDEENESFGG